MRGHDSVLGALSSPVSPFSRYRGTPFEARDPSTSRCAGYATQATGGTRDPRRDGTVTGARSVWFGDNQRPAFGWFHSPRDNLARGGVVICPPLGFDYLHGHYALKLLAERLAAAGFCALRFDYDGTGDSAGNNGDPGRLDAWTATVRSAITLVRESGAGEVSLAGMRLGAALAAHAAATDGRIDQVVLWDPCAGRTFLREQRAISTITLGSSEIPSDGSLEIPGVVYDASTVREVEALSIEKCSLPLARRVLVLARADRPVNRALVGARLAREQLSHEEAAGQAEFMDRYPPLQELPHEAISRIVAWLSEGAVRTVGAVRTPQPAGPRLVGRGESGIGVVEAPVSIPPAGLFGILTYAEHLPVPTDTPTAILLNVANQHHIGPNRLWVEWSRQWAMAGIRSLRLDMSGLGDSPDRHGEHGRWASCRPEAFDDVLDAARWVSPDEPSNVVLVGLCSAGYQALESALAIRARGVVAINPVISFVPEEEQSGAVLDPRRRIIFPREDVVSNLPRESPPARFPERFPDLAWRARAVSHPGRRSGRWLAELVRQGTDTLLVCGDAELRPIRQGSTSRHLERLQRSGRLSIQHLAGLQHDLFIADQRRLVTSMVTEHMLAKFSGQSCPPRASLSQ